MADNCERKIVDQETQVSPKDQSGNRGGIYQRFADIGDKIFVPPQTRRGSIDMKGIGSEIAIMLSRRQREDQ